jgi:phosphoribosylpyrophosphate synthetase
MTKQVLDLFTGTANPELASEVSKILGINISKADVGYFSDGEIKVQIEIMSEVMILLYFNLHALLQIKI